MRTKQPTAQHADPDRIVSIIEIERAINHWRNQFPSSRDTMTLCPEAACLAELYARMILFHINQIPWLEFSAKAKSAFLNAEQSADTAQHKAA